MLVRVNFVQRSEGDRGQGHQKTALDGSKLHMITQARRRLGQGQALLDPLDRVSGRSVVHADSAGGIGHGQALHQVQAGGFAGWAGAQAQELRQGLELGVSHKTCQLHG